MVESQVATEKNNIIKSNKESSIALVVGLGLFVVGSFDTFINEPIARNSIIKDTPECSSLNLDYSLTTYGNLRTRAASLLIDSKIPLDELANDAELKNTVNCYRAVKRQFESQPFYASGTRSGLSGMFWLTGLFLAAAGFLNFDRRRLK